MEPAFVLLLFTRIVLQLTVKDILIFLWESSLIKTRRIVSHITMKNDCGF